MSETKSKTVQHTPGPWHFGEGTSKTPGGVGSRNKAPICKMAGCTPEDVANARLMSAAPDMLSACIKLVGWYEANAPDVLGGPHDAYEIASEAIAKAKGPPARELHEGIDFPSDQG